MKITVMFEEILKKAVEVEIPDDTDRERCEIVAQKAAQNLIDSGDVVLMADDYADRNFYIMPGGKEDLEGICPICGGELIYDFESASDQTEGVVRWHCDKCGAVGCEGYDKVFDHRHYNVRDKHNRTIPERYPFE